MDQLFIWMNSQVSASSELVPFMLRKLVLAFALIGMVLYFSQSARVLGGTEEEKSEA